MYANPLALVALLLIPLQALFAIDPRLASRPNILVILTDDQGWASLGCYGSKIVATPNLDRLAAQAYALPMLMPCRNAHRLARRSSRASTQPERDYGMF